MAQRKPRQNTPKARSASPRGAGGKWLPGQSPNPGGRPKDIAEVRELAREHTATALQTLVKISMTGKSESARIAAATALLDRGWGKPALPLANDDERPLVMPVLNVVIAAPHETAATD